jgi:membrane-bound lytic murein transglycosylase D
MINMTVLKANMRLPFILIAVFCCLPLLVSSCATKTGQIAEDEALVSGSDPSKPPLADTSEETSVDSPRLTEPIEEQTLEQVSKAPLSPAPIDEEPADDAAIVSAPQTSSSATTLEQLPATVNSQKPKANPIDEALELCEVSQELWQAGELEEALEALDQAYALILKVDTYDNPKLIQQKEDLRFTISKRILEIYASRNIVVNGNYNAIPLVINKHVQAEINLFTKGAERKFFMQSLQRSGRYQPYFAAKIKEAGLPQELSWLPLIESGFKVNALSRARALGLWQFISSTGYKFGLKRDKFVDERLDPEKATQAAIAYLQELHQIFGDWATALAGYNCGEGRVLRVIRTQNINYLDNFWDLYEQLPRETARYVPRFIATLHIVGNLEKYGLDDVVLDSPLTYETVTINKQVHLKSVAQTLGVTLSQLKALNPELRYQIVPPQPYALRVPQGEAQNLIARLDQVPVAHPPQRAYAYHRVRRGETLSTIAARYRTSPSRIARANNLRSHHYIVAGKTLKIPLGRSQRVYKSTTVRKQRATGQAHTHIVHRGDSLWNLARRYGTTTKKIQSLNNLSGSNLYIGQVLKIGEPQIANATSKDKLKVYQVKRNDTPYRIAKKHNMKLQDFLAINQLSKRSKIFPGQELWVE